MKKQLTDTVDKVLLQELQKVVQDLQEKHIELGQKASGKWIDTIQVTVSNGHGVIYAQNYTQYLVKGRKNGKRPPIDPLEKWVNNKFGINGKDARGIAFAIAFKIGKEGTEIYKQGGTDLVDSVINNKRIEQIKQKIKHSIVFEIKKSLRLSLVA